MMMRLAAIFVVVCMVMIAASVGAIGLSAGLACGAAESVIVALVDPDRARPLQRRRRPRSATARSSAPRSPIFPAASADLARQVAEDGRRVAALERQGTRSSTAAETRRGPSPTHRRRNRRARHAGQAARRDRRAHAAEVRNRRSQPATRRPARRETRRRTRLREPPQAQRAPPAEAELAAAAGQHRSAAAATQRT